MLLVLATLVLLLVGPGRLTSLFDTGTGTTFFRLQLWRSSVAMVRDHELVHATQQSKMNIIRYFKDGLENAEETVCPDNSSKAQKEIKGMIRYFQKFHLSGYEIGGIMARKYSDSLKKFEREANDVMCGF